jgi:LPP20 lipoprotein
MNIILMLVLLSSCSLFSPQKSGLSDTESEAPGWVYSPYEFCQEGREFCTSGEGRTLSEAEANAKAQLGSIFEVKVKSEFQSLTTSSQSFPWQSQVREEAQKSLSESVDQVLEAVEIKKRFKKKGLNYALASLDREKASDLLGDRLKKIDQELIILWEKKQRTNFRKLIKLFYERERLNERFSVVSNGPRTSPVSWDQLVKWRESRPAREEIFFKVGQSPDWLKEKLEELLTQAGFKLVKGNISKGVTLQVEGIKEFLNVNGFEKHTFTLSLSSFEGGEKKRTLSKAETVTGRSQADALLKVKTIFTEYLEEHLSDLDLD